MSVFDPYIQNGLGVRSAVAQKAYHDAQAQSGLQNAVAYQNALHGLAQADPYRNAGGLGLGLQLSSREGHMTLPNAGTGVITETPKGHRTPEEIQAQLEARYAEMEAEAERMAKAALTACSTCRWRHGAFCKQPLVTGVKPKAILTVDAWKPKGDEAYLCGPEKALWEPKLTRWQKFMEWMHRMIDRLEAPLALTSGKG
jgi:hypothetical protein